MNGKKIAATALMAACLGGSLLMPMAAKASNAGQRELAVSVRTDARCFLHRRHHRHHKHHKGLLSVVIHGKHHR